MKKILLLILALVLCLGVMTACFEPIDDSTDDDQNETPVVSDDLQAAMDYLWGMYKKAETETASSFDRTSVVAVEGVRYAVEWTVDNDAISIVEKDENTVTVVVPEPSEAISYTLTATIKDSEGNSLTKTFEHIVPKFKVLTFEEYIATEDGKAVVIEGIVAGMNSKSEAIGNKRNHIFLVDESGKGGYYAYDIDHDPVALGIEIGMKVRIAGTLDIYNGIYEIVDGDGNQIKLTIVDSDKVTVPVIDITENFAAGNDLHSYIGAFVTIKGVELGAQELGGSSDYLFFTLNGRQSYVRSYLTDLEAGIKSAANKAAIEADHLAHFGYKADVTGLLVYYGTTPYIIPVSVTPFTNYQEQEKSDAEKIAAELGDIKLDGTITADTVINVITAGKFYNDVVISWASDNAAISYADGKLTVVVPDSEISVKITVTATCGDATDSKEITVKLSKKVISAGAANEIAGGVTLDSAGTGYTEGKYLVGGVIKNITSDEYGNMYIVDSEGNEIYIYGVYTKDGTGKFNTLATKPAVGDYIVVLGVLGQYKNSIQLKSGWLQEHVAASSIKDAVDAGTAAGSTYTEEKYLVTGKVTEIASNTYGNVYIEDAEGNRIYIYGLYGIDGKRYDAMATKPAVGDTITVISTAGAYNGTPQLKNATLLVITAATDGGDGGDGDDGDDPTPTLPANGSTLTASQALALKAILASGATSTAKYYISGTITEFYGSAGLTYGNVYIKDAEGNTILIYGLVDEDGNKYDAMTTKPVIGDTITVYGVINNYNGTIQFKNATVTAHTPADGGDGGDDDDTTGDDTTTITNIADALEAADGAKVVLRGIVVSVEAWSTEFNNMSVTIKDADGNSIYVFRLVTKVGLGDEIIVTGKMGTYNSNRQIAQGATAEIVVVHGDNHTYVGGACSVCGSIEPVAGQEIVSVSIVDYAATNSWTNGTKYTTINANDVITITAAGGTNTGKYYTSGTNWRIYQGESPTVTITAAEGKTIVSVKISYVSNNNGVLTCNGANIETDALVSVNASSVNFSVGNTGTANNGQARITAIEVVYQ